tara:strand:- start:245 stop:1690 length:1446 start_codon:yes stop_codon:yes gene_type:complete
MGGKRSKKKKTKTSAQKAAAARHAKFKQTKVQTFGGKRKSFSKSEESRIKKAGYSVKGYSQAAPNKASGYSGTTGVSIGSKIKNPNPKTTGVGPVASGSEYANMLKASPPKLNQLGRNEVNQDLAGAGYTIEDKKNVINYQKKIQADPTYQMKGFERDSIMRQYGKQVYNPTDTKIALGGDNLGSMFGVGSVIGAGLALPSLIKGAAEKGNELRKNLERKLNPEESQNQSSLGTGGNLVSSLANQVMGIRPVSAITMKSPDSFGYPSQDAVDKAAGITAGGLNIGGSGFTPDNPSGSRSRVLTSEQLGDAYKSTLNPNSFKGLSDGETVGSGPVASGEDYARGLNVDNKNVENRIRSAVNLIPGVNVRKLTDKEIADNRISAQKKLAYRNEMSKIRKGASGGNRLPVTPTVIEEILPEALPVPSASTTPTTQTGVDPNRLLQIQQQAYAQAYNPMLIGGFNPQFRFGAATPTIDYSTYFNY